MSAVKMPEPIGYLKAFSVGALADLSVNGSIFTAITRAETDESIVAIFSTTQAQAYADARVMEALEKALAVIANEQKSICDDDHELGWSDCADAIYRNIRALIPSAN